MSGSFRRLASLPSVWRGSLALVLSALALVSGCTDRTAILVEVRSSDLAVPADVDTLRFEARTDAGQTVDKQFALHGNWPYSLAIQPGSASSADDVLISVTALREGAFVTRRVVRVAFGHGETRVAPVELHADCRGVMCADGVDCVAGACVGELPDAGPAGDDAGTDAGSDETDGGAAPGDAGVEAGDAGAEPVDGGRRDGGSCHVAAEVCNGSDDDCNGAIDDRIPCVGSVVISEVAVAGSGGAGDEFVELYNRTPYPIDLGGVAVEYRSASGAGYSSRSTAPPGATIPGYGFYLFRGRDYVGSVAGDAPEQWVSSLAAAGGHVRITSGEVELDRFGWGTAVAPEGRVFPPLPDANVGSYERKAFTGSTSASMAGGGADVTRGNGFDGDNNANDFVARTSRDPQNTASVTESP